MQIWGYLPPEIQIQSIWVGPRNLHFKCPLPGVFLMLMVQGPYLEDHWEDHLQLREVGSNPSSTLALTLREWLRFSEPQFSLLRNGEWYQRRVLGRLVGGFRNEVNITTSNYYGAWSILNQQAWVCCSIIILIIFIIPIIIVCFLLALWFHSFFTLFFDYTSHLLRLLSSFHSLPEYLCWETSCLWAGTTSEFNFSHCIRQCVGLPMANQRLISPI